MLISKWTTLWWMNSSWLQKGFLRDYRGSFGNGWVIYPTPYIWCIYLTMLGLNLNHVSKTCLAWWMVWLSFVTASVLVGINYLNERAGAEHEESIVSPWCVITRYYVKNKQISVVFLVLIFQATKIATGFTRHINERKALPSIDVTKWAHYWLRHLLYMMLLAIGPLIQSEEVKVVYLGEPIQSTKVILGRKMILKMKQWDSCIKNYMSVKIISKLHFTF